mmetsp:Transcript_4419/g.15500  ORF Transcript_4419/g.15500 Transcript_4419/m.15500 type:complete len:328 (+) Transcript_4419:208-1191(+)
MSGSCEKATRFRRSGLQRYWSISSSSTSPTTSSSSMAKASCPWEGSARPRRLGAVEGAITTSDRHACQASILDLTVLSRASDMAASLTLFCPGAPWQPSSAAAAVSSPGAQLCILAIHSITNSSEISAGSCQPGDGRWPPPSISGSAGRELNGLSESSLFNARRCVEISLDLDSAVIALQPSSELTLASVTPGKVPSSSLSVSRLLWMTAATIGMGFFPVVRYFPSQNFSSVMQQCLSCVTKWTDPPRFPMTPPTLSVEMALSRSSLKLNAGSTNSNSFCSRMHTVFRVFWLQLMASEISSWRMATRSFRHAAYTHAPTRMFTSLLL